MPTPRREEDSPTPPGAKPSLGQRRAAGLREPALERGLPAPRPQESLQRWTARVERAVGQGRYLDAVRSRIGGVYLAAAWRAAGGRNTERTSAFLAAAYDLLHLAASTYEENDNEEGSEPAVYELWRDIVDGKLHAGVVGAECGLRVAEIEGGYLLDDGTYQEGFAFAHEAKDAILEWTRRERASGRGLPFVDDDSLQNRRCAEAEADDAPLARLIELADDPCEDVLEALAERAMLPVEVMRAMRRGAYSDLRLCTRRDLPPDLVDVLVAEADDACLVNLALAGYDTDELVRAVERSHGVRAEILAELPSDGPLGIGTRMAAALGVAASDEEHDETSTES